MFEGAFQVGFRIIERLVEPSKLIHDLVDGPGRDEINQTCLTSQILVACCRQEPTFRLQTAPKICSWSSLKKRDKHLRYAITHGKIYQTLVSSGSLMVKTQYATRNDLQAGSIYLTACLVQVYGNVLKFLGQLKAILIGSFYTEEHSVKPGLPH